MSAKLFHRGVIGGLLLTFMVVSCKTNDNQNIEIIALNNCSYLYRYGKNKLLIDPFGTDFGRYFFLTSDSTLKKLGNGEAPFKGVETVLITHIHGDHFNPFLAETFLQKHNSSKMVCPPQVLHLMKDSCRNFNSIEDRIISPELAMAQTQNLTINDVPLTVVRMQHGTDRSLEGIDYSNFTDYEKTENFGYVIRLNNKTIFHQGDGCLNINGEALNALSLDVNVAYLSFFDWDSISYQILKDQMLADTIIFMHGTRPADELQKLEFIPVKSKIFFFSKKGRKWLYLIKTGKVLESLVLIC